MINRRTIQQIQEAAKPTRLDKMIESVAPRWGARRAGARMQLAMREGYVGASRSRRQLSEWDVLSGVDPDDIAITDYPSLRDRSRDLHRNSAVARGAFNVELANVIGTGLKLSARINEKTAKITRAQASELETVLETEFWAWASSKYCDIERKQNLYGQQVLALRECMMGGDVFVILPDVKDTMMPYQLTTQLINAERVTNPKWTQDSATLVQGIEKNALGAPIAVHVQNKNSYSMRDPAAIEWTKYTLKSSNGRNNILHVHRPVTIGQTRGEPYLAPIIEPLKMLERWTEAELMATVISSMLTVFLKTEGATGFAPMEGLGQPLQQEARPATEGFKMGSGAILELGTNESVEVVDPKRPNSNYEAFFLSIIKQIAMALDMPFEILLRYFNSSYSASRAAMLEAWRSFVTRREWFGQAFCQPIYENFVMEAVALGRVSIPGFFAMDYMQRAAYLGSEWTGPARGMIDETKEVDAAFSRIEKNLSTYADEVMLLTGKDWEDVLAQRLREKEKLKELGMEEPTSKPAAPGEEKKPGEEEKDEDSPPAKPPSIPAEPEEGEDE